MEKVNKDFIYRWVERAFYFAAIGMILLIIVSIFYDLDIRGLESNVVYSLQLALKSNSLLYGSPESFPFNVTQYSPLYYLINDGIISLFSIEPENFFIIWAIARSVSVIILILALLSLKNILQYRLNIPKETSIIIVLLFLIISYPWYNISRPDVLLLLFFVLSVRSILLYQTDKKIARHAILLGVFLALGVFSKLTMAIFIVAFGVYMLITRNWKLIIISAASFILSSALLCLLLWLSTYDLTYINKNIINGVQNGYSIVNAAITAYKEYFNYFGLFSIVVLLIGIYTLKSWKNITKNQVLLFLITITLTIGALSFFSALKVGSAINYFNEFFLCVIVLSIYILENYHLNYKKLYMICFMVFGISTALNQAFLYAPLIFGKMFTNHFEKRTNEIAEIKNYLALHLKSNYFFSDNRTIAMSFPYRCILFPTDIHNTTFDQKAYNYHLLEEWAKDKLVYLVLDFDKKELYGIDIKKDYTLIKEYPHYYLYKLNSYNE